MASSLTLTLAVFLAVALSLANGFCWRKAYGRGVGTLPFDCGPGKEYDAGLCYPPCQSGYKGVGPVCWQWCPDGWTDHGVGCTKPPPYGRGVGYVWTSLCEAEYGVGNCEKWGLLIYPKCKSGFWAFGCCICTPNCPPGFTDSGATCIKSSYGRGVGTVPTSCTDGKEYDFGLCYPPCEPGYKGVGPVCWGRCPEGHRDCLAGCAADGAECATTTKDQFMSVMDVVATAIDSIGISEGTEVVAKKSFRTAVQGAVKNFAKNLTKAQFKEMLVEKMIEHGETVQDKLIESVTNAAYGAEFDIRDLDPTGVSQIVRAFKRDVCT